MSISFKAQSVTAIVLLKYFEVTSIHTCMRWHRQFYTPTPQSIMLVGSIVAHVKDPPSLTSGKHIVQWGFLDLQDPSLKTALQPGIPPTCQ